MRFRNATIVFFSLALMTIAAVAQTGSITGQVLDVNGGMFMGG